MRLLEFLGVLCDKDKNGAMMRGNEGEISGGASRVKVLVIPTNEELVIARDTYRLVQEK